MQTDAERAAWWESTCEEWRKMCQEAWRQRDLAQATVDALREEIHGIRTGKEGYR